VYFRRTRYRAGAIVIALDVVSHWAFDLIADGDG